MGFPASLQLITLTGDFRDGADNGNPREGVVTITLPTPILSQGDNVIIPPFDLEIEMTDGTFSVDLPATTDPEWEPNTAAYIVQAVFPDGWRKLWWALPLPYDAAGGSVDLADVGAPNVGTPSLTVRQGTSQPIPDGGYRGTWSAGTMYRVGDTIQYGSNVYGALRVSAGVTPGTAPATWKIYPSSGGGGVITSVFGRTGDVVAQTGDYTKAQVGLGNVDNTSDAAKPVSTAQAAADTTVATNAANALAAHAADTTAIHGIADTAQLATLADIAGRQPLDSDLTDIAALAPVDGSMMRRSSGIWVAQTMAQVKTALSLVKGDVGLGNVDNTSDASKPVSTAQQTALDLKVDKSLVDAKGDLLTATADNTPARLGVGTDGQVLTADSTQATGLKWAAGGGGGIPATIVDAKGDIIAATAADTVARVAVGSNGQFLKADSAQSAGVGWVTLSIADVAQLAEELLSGGGYYPVHGYGLIAMSGPPPAFENASNTGNDTIQLTRLWVPANKAINGVAVAQVGSPGAIGAGSAGAANGLAVYSDSGTLLQSKSGGASFWEGSVGWKPLTFDTPVAAQATGRFVYAAILVQGYDTQPNLMFKNTDVNALMGGVGVTNRRQMFGGATSFPSSINTATFGSTSSYMTLIGLF